MSTPSANPTFKLYYFNLRAMAETTRFLFAYGGIAYEDIRVTWEEWPKIKPTTPMGQLPVVEVDGYRVHQSFAINRFLAKRIGLAGANEWESLQVDSVVDTINDLRQKIVAVRFEENEETKKVKTVTLETETIPFYLNKLEEIAKENNGHLATKNLTWADFFFAVYFEVFQAWLGSTFWDKYPQLQKVANNVFSLDAIKTWRNKRPDSEY